MRTTPGIGKLKQRKVDSPVNDKSHTCHHIDGRVHLRIPYKAPLSYHRYAPNADAQKLAVHVSNRYHRPLPIMTIASSQSLEHIIRTICSWSHPPIQQHVAHGIIGKSVSVFSVVLTPVELNAWAHGIQML